MLKIQFLSLIKKVLLLNPPGTKSDLVLNHPPLLLSSSSIMESSQISITFQFVKLSREWSGQNNVQWPFIKIFHRQKWHHWTKLTLRFVSFWLHERTVTNKKKTEKTVAHWSVIRCNIIWDRGARASWLHIDCTEAVRFFLLSFKKIHIKVYVYLDIYGNPENYKSILWRLFSEEGKEWPKIFFLVTMQRTPRGSLLWKNFGEIQSILNIQYVFFFHVGDIIYS